MLIAKGLQQTRQGAPTFCDDALSSARAHSTRPLRMVSYGADPSRAAMPASPNVSEARVLRVRC